MLSLFYRYKRNNEQHKCSEVTQMRHKHLATFLIAVDWLRVNESETKGALTKNVLTEPRHRGHYISASNRTLNAKKTTTTARNRNSSVVLHLTGFPASSIRTRLTGSHRIATIVRILSNVFTPVYLLS